MILNIRGCNGSGKSTLARGLLSDRAAHWNVGGVTCTYDPPLLLVGPYLGKNTPGCDCLKTFDDTRAAIRAALKIGVENIVFEGVVISTVYSSWAAFDDELGRRVTWAFLDTPLDVCLARIQARNGGKPINEQLVADKVKAIATVRRKVLADGRDVIDLGEDALDVVRMLM